MKFKKKILLWTTPLSCPLFFLSACSVNTPNDQDPQKDLTIVNVDRWERDYSRGVDITANQLCYWSENNTYWTTNKTFFYSIQWVGTENPSGDLYFSLDKENVIYIGNFHW
jgi:hypothetical protein